MSADQPKGQPVSLSQLVGRITELKSQLDYALARCTILAGDRQEALEMARHLGEENEILKSQIASMSEPATEKPGDTATGSAPEGGAPTA